MVMPTTILVVDDQPNIRAAMAICLEEAGYLVRQASNGAEALEEAVRQPPEVMVLDLAMPVMDGMSVLAEMRTMLKRLPTRVIVMTAHGSVKTAIAAIRLGATDFLEKPFVPEELRSSIASTLRQAAPIGSDQDYAQVLERVRQALRSGQFDEAERDLMRAGTITGEDSAFLNLAGILHESHGRVDSARRFYERASARDQDYYPAQENLKRLAELRQTGQTTRGVAFGGGSWTKEETLTG
jgi:DNA-binding response OmpR family regulator